MESDVTKPIVRKRFYNFHKSVLGGFDFVEVVIRKCPEYALPFYLEANVCSVNEYGKFKAGARLTSGPYKTLKAAKKTCNQFGPVFVKCKKGSSFEDLVQKAIKKYYKQHKWEIGF